MSRRLGGRFGANTSEAYQRQLTAPVHKWKKAWVAPSGLQPESSYKICKWVRVDTADADEGTPLPDEDEEMDEGEEGDEVEGEDGADVVDGEAGEGEEVAEGGVEAAVPGASASAPLANGSIPPLSTETPATEVPNPSLAPSTAAVAAPVEANTSTTATLTDPAAHHDLPPNAIEITNTAPGGTEVGHGDLGADSGVELIHGEPHDLDADPKRAEGDAREQGGVDAKVEASSAAAAAQMDEAEKGIVPEVDSGLVMGDLEPERKEFEVQGEDKPREKDEVTDIREP